MLVDNAMDLVEAVMPPPTDEQFEARLTAALARCAQVGLTGVHDAGMDLRTFSLLKRWDAAGRLPLRVYAMADGQGADRETYLELGPFQGRPAGDARGEVPAGRGAGQPGRGAARSRTATSRARAGLLLLSPEEFEARVRAFMARGFQVAIHAIGDRANTLVLDTLLRVAGPTGAASGRHRVEHAQMLRLEDIAKLGAAGLIASVQPTHATSDMPWAETRLGPERLKGAYAWQRAEGGGGDAGAGERLPDRAAGRARGAVRGAHAAGRGGPARGRVVPATSA